MLKKLRLHNFRTFLNAEIDFTQRHLLIGRNNSGKTNLCSALRFLAATASNDLAASVAAIPGGINEIKNWATRIPETEVSCTCELPFEGANHDFVYELRFRLDVSSDPTQRGQLALRVVEERLTVQSPGHTNVVLLESDGREAQILDDEQSPVLGEPRRGKILAPRDATMLAKLYELETNRRTTLFRKYLSSWSYFVLSPEHARFGWLDPEIARRGAGLVPRGDDLALVLFNLKNMNEQLYRRVIEHIHIVEPDLEAINFFPSPDQPPVPSVALRNQPRASWTGLSDGTLRCLGLATIIEFTGAWSTNSGLPPPLVIIEEPENGVYPGQLRSVFDLFEERAPEVQFVFTSHSPYFINFFDGSRDSVTLLRRRGERTEVVPVPPVDDGPERELLAEQYSMELFG